MARTSEQAGQEWTDHFTYDPDTGGITASNPDTDEREPEAYQYDKIGNRLEASKGNQTTKYEANALNQYTAISDLPSSISRAPAHDADGNQTREDNRTYTWDGENRLVAIQEGSSIIAKYTYDHQSRRIARWINDGTDERYLYDGWNLIAVYQKGDTKPVETYTWGKDLSGTLQGAGGVGGLLFAQIQGAKPNTWIYHYDANGNITQVTHPRGTILEQNTYDIFGNTTTESLIPNRYCFSTKPQDRESGYNYYGYRYYNPNNGKWLSRDPIGENGGIGLYSVALNDCINGADILGLKRCCVSEPLSVTWNPYGLSTTEAINIFAYFEIEATFSAPSGDCCPECCDFRQDVSNYLVESSQSPSSSTIISNDPAMNSNSWGQLVPSNSYVRDGYGSDVPGANTTWQSIAGSEVKAHSFYDAYFRTDSLSEIEYVGYDRPGYAPNAFGNNWRYSGWFEFRGYIWDTCNGSRVGSRRIYGFSWTDLALDGVSPSHPDFTKWGFDN